jgi:hypothetical protein
LNFFLNAWQKGVTKMHQISKAKDDELTTPANIKGQ